MVSKAWCNQLGITGLETAIVLIAFVVVSSVFAFAALSTGLFSSDKSKETINAGLTEARGTLEMRGDIIAKSLAVTSELVVNGTGATTGDLNNIPVLSGSETVTHSGDGVMTKVTGSPAAGEYSINYTTGLVTVDALTAGEDVKVTYTAQIVDENTFQLANAAGGASVDPTTGETLITYTDANQSLTLAIADMTVTALGSADADKLVEPGEMYELKVTGLVSALGTDLKKDTAFSIEIKPPQGAVLHIERRTPVLLEKSINLASDVLIRLHG